MRRSQTRPGTRLGLRTAALCAALVLVAAHPPAAVSTGLVISQVYGGGGNSGAPWTHDFVEIFNGSASAVPLAGLSIQYGSATGSGSLGASETQLTELPAVSVAPGGYFLVQMAGGTSGAPLPPPDHVDPTPIALAAGSGKVALVTGTTSLGCNGGSAPCSAAQLARIVDLVGYGGATFFEGAAPAPEAGSAAAVVRTAGNVDTDHNAADFALAAPPTPRIGGIAGARPRLSIGDATISEGNATATLRFTLTLSAPADGDVTYAVATHDETATAGLDYLALSLTGQRIPAGTTSVTHDVTILGDTAQEPGETFAVVVADLDGADAGDLTARGTIANDDVPFTPIHELQGRGDASPYADADVATAGIVTARKSNGFFVQTPDDEADADARTSNALFVFTSVLPAVAVGDEVRVSGRLVEFRGANAATAGTLTEITNPNVEVRSPGHRLPAPVDVSVLLGRPRAFTSRAAQLERFEGMLVRARGMDVVGPTNAFGELVAVPAGTARPFREPGIDVGEPLPAEAPPTVPRYDGNFERLTLDTDDLVDAAGVRRARLDVPAGTASAPVRLAPVAGPLDYAFDSYRIAIDATTVVTGGRRPQPVPARRSGEFTVASFNLENFRDGTPNIDSRRQKAARIVVEILRMPDILGLIEVGDLEDLQLLAAAVNSAAGTTYAAYLEDGDGQASGFEQNVGYLVNTARVEVLATRQVYRGKTFEFAGQTDLLHDRPPYILEARVRASRLPVTVILNHLRSLIDVNSQEPLPGGGGLTAGARVREKRRLQAEDLADLVASRIQENLVVLGDMNAFEVNDGLVDVIGTVKGAPAPPDQVTAASADRWTHQLTEAAALLPAAQRYSYVFDGVAQSLDHLLVNQAMRGRLTRFAQARNNADFPDSFEADFTVTTRLSDHDAAVAYFTPASDLRVTAAAEGPFVAGGEASVRVTAASRHDAASDVRVSLVLPPGVGWLRTAAPDGWSCTGGDGTVTCGTASLDAGARETLRFALAVGCDVADGTVLALPATIATTAGDVRPDTAVAVAAVANRGPAIRGVAVSRARLPPALHQMVPVYVDYDAGDRCGPVRTWLRVRSDEAVTGRGQGPAGTTAPDWDVVDAHRVRLRAEHAVPGNGRVYTITIVAANAAGGRARREVQVVVPRQSRH